jgi:DNA ligase-1
LLPSFVKLVNSVQCKGMLYCVSSLICEGPEHLKEYFNEVVAKGGEGVMLREANSLYKGGRSPTLRKYKEYFDTEVKVLENEYPHGFKCLQ